MTDLTKPAVPWLKEPSAKRFEAISRWSEGYYFLAPDGYLHVDPTGADLSAINMADLVTDLRHSGVSLPALVRFPQILQSRVAHLRSAFEQAGHTLEHPVDYCPLYPVKANQDRAVVEAIASSPGPIGLEAGSKPELLAALGVARPGTPIVCNGFKDRAFIRAALVGCEAGYEVCIVIERLEEASLIVEEATALGVTPRIGLRVRVTAPGSTRWADSGDGSKFGLSSAQLLHVVKTLRDAGFLHAVKLVHFHMGSQVGDLSDYRRSCDEGLRHLAALSALGCPIDTIDVGGGLGVDYEGSASIRPNSTNFGIDLYAQTIVAAVIQCRHAYSLPPLRIFTETGRAISAHHAVLLFEAEAETDDAALRSLVSAAKQPSRIAEAATLSLQELRQLADTPGAPLEDAHRHYAELCAAYGRNEADLHALAEADALVAHMRRQSGGRVSRLLANFSLFQSLTDHWALGQTFPVLRVDTPVDECGTEVFLHDLTCDSDGCLQSGEAETVFLPTVELGKPAVIGVFLVGAYQEGLGPNHNLFGRVDVVEVRSDAIAGTTIQRLSRADTCADVLSRVGYDPSELSARWTAQLASHSVLPINRCRGAELLDELLESSPYLMPEIAAIPATQTHRQRPSTHIEPVANVDVQACVTS